MNQVADNKMETVGRFDAERVRADFPVLHQQIHGNRLAYLDSAASAQQPKAVTEAIRHYSEHDHANVHRGVHSLSQRATDAFEAARDNVRQFINADSIREIVFTRGTTEAINLVAASFDGMVKPGDEILITHMEHHSNIVPWQMLCNRTGALLKVAPIDQTGQLLLDRLYEMLNPRTKLVALAHISNALGTINPVKQIIAAAHERDIPVLIDGAQAAPHATLDMQQLDCDFYAFSGHKMCGPTGIGVLYGRERWLETLPPWQGGGEMILTVDFDKTVYNSLPFKFEAGTPNIAGAIGLSAAIDYLQTLGMASIASYESELLTYLTEQLSQVDGVRLIGTAQKKAAVQSFLLDGVHPHDLGTVLDHKGVAIRTGHHCAMPLMELYGLPGTARASLAFYNDRQDIDQLIDGLALAADMFA